ncbi:hypothetical protein GCM10008967_14140 [Bacillus carboniphilus]|uniref:Uncharacterized protein n=1 Tax=Bacillus carboniphilus TaxID=86663 RepID=A0ABN0W4I8_9BACI
MKRSYRGVLLLLIVLMLNIIITQKAVFHFYYENYSTTIFLATLNVILFPLALWIYKKEKNPDKGVIKK